MLECYSLRLLSLVLVSVLVMPQAEVRQPVFARKAMVVAQEEHATDVGLAVLRSGGNAVDAAVAVGFALAVTHPYAGNIGGGGFMLIRLADGRATFIDFRERAPGKASRDMYLDVTGKPTDESIVGWRAAAVPGTVRGLELAHKRYGRKPWAELVKPAVDLATNGFPVSFPQMDSWKHYASLLAATMAEQGGLIALADLHDYQAVERKPMEGDYKASTPGLSLPREEMGDRLLAPP